MGKKQKKEEVVYYDDGRTIADMSGLDRRMPLSRGTTSSFRDIWATYWDATRMMVRPLLVAVGGIGLIYVIMYVLFSLAA